MKLNQVLKHYSGKSMDIPTTAGALSLTPACIYKWRENEYIPYKSQIVIELHSQGKLKANKKHGKPIP